VKQHPKPNAAKHQPMPKAAKAPPRQNAPATPAPIPAPNGKVFGRLFEQSTCKKKPLAPPEEEAVEPQAPSINSKSIMIARRHEIEKIKAVFAEEEVCERSQLVTKLSELGILDSTCSDREIQIIHRGIDSCVLDGGQFNAKKMKRKLLDSVTKKKQHKFHRLVNHKLLIARANDKAVLPVVQEDVPAETAVKMRKVTFERLVAARPAPAPAEDVGTPQVLWSDASRRILRSSQRTKDLERMSLEERDRALLQRKTEALQKLGAALEEDERKEMQAPANLGAMPEFYDKLPDDWKQRAPKEIPQEPESFKPKVTPYHEYQRKRERLAAKQVIPVGWDESVQRLRLARTDRNELREALDPRSGPVKLSQQGHYSEWKKRVTRPEKNVRVVRTDAVDAALGISIEYHQ
jgi:hypothetical protein